MLRRAHSGRQAHEQLGQSRERMSEVISGHYTAYGGQVRQVSGGINGSIDSAVQRSVMEDDRACRMGGLEPSGRGIAVCCMCHEETSYRNV